MDCALPGRLAAATNPNKRSELSGAHRENCSHLPMTNNARKLNRRELFDMVWSTPIQKLAKELGLSDRGLAKICVRHRIPNPPRGYWARLAAGQQVKRPSFPAMHDPSRDEIRIVPTVSPLVAGIIEKARQMKAEQRNRDPEGVEALAINISVPVDKPHYAIAATARALRKQKPDEWGSVSAIGDGLCGVVIQPDLVERVISILQMLATELDKDGLHMQPAGQRMRIVVGSDDVAFTIVEKATRQKHSPTAQELEAYERQEAKRVRAAARKDWQLYSALPYQKPWPEFDRVHSGELIFSIESWAPGLRKTWSDGKRQTLEGMLENIVLGLKVVLAHEKQRREEREEDARRRAEYARRLNLLNKRHEREDQRIKYFRELHSLQEEIARIEKWLASLPSDISPDHSTDIGRMVIWAQDRSTKLKMKVSVKSVAAALTRESFFPEADELHDPLGDPEKPRGHFW